MTSPKPVKVIVELEDGTTKESSFDSLPSQLQAEIFRHPFSSQPSADPREEKFVVLEWDDGWKEVFQVNSECTDINRYYVISRPEDIGRLSINTKEGYPELLEIARSPRNITRIGFVDTFDLTLQQSAREGSKVDHFYSLEAQGDLMAEIVQAFQDAWAEEGIDVDEIREEGIPGLLYRVSRKMDLRAGFRQQDLYDFLKKLADQAGLLNIV